MAEYTIKQLVAASHCPERSIRQYVLEGMLPRAPYRGKDTVYGDDHLIALRAITKLRKEQKMHRLAPLRAWFAGKSREEIAAFVTGAPITPATPPSAPSHPIEPEPLAPVTDPAPEPVLAGEKWAHLPLLPGMVLLVREGAPAVVARMAEEIRAKYGAQ